MPKGAGRRRGGKPRSDKERIMKHFSDSEEETEEIRETEGATAIERIGSVNLAPTVREKEAEENE